MYRAISAMFANTHWPFSGSLTGVNELGASWSRSMPTSATGSFTCRNGGSGYQPRPAMEEEWQKTHETRWSILGLLVLALDESPINKDRVLSFSSHQRCDDVVAELTVACLRAQLNRVLVVESSGHKDFAPGELGNGRSAAERISAPPSVRVDQGDALDAGGQPDRRLVKLVVQLVNEVDLPVQPLDLPDAESERKDGHQADEQKEGASAELVASALREGGRGGMADGGEGGRRELAELSLTVSVPRVPSSRRFDCTHPGAWRYRSCEDGGER